MAEFTDPYQDKGFLGRAWMSLMPGAYERNLSKNQLDYASTLQGEMGERPELETSRSTRDATDLLSSLVSTGLPDAAAQRYINQVNRGTSEAISSATGMGVGLEAISGIQATQNDAMLNLLSMDSQAMIDNRKALAAQKNLVGQEEKEQFFVNKLQPYERELNEMQAMFGASIANRQSGNIATQNVIGSAANLGTAMLTGGASGLFGGTGEQNGSSIPEDLISVLQSLTK